MATAITPPKLVHLREGLSDYVERRADKHGWIYLVRRSFGGGSLVEAQSIATGALCTFKLCDFEEMPDGQEAA